MTIARSPARACAWPMNSPTAASPWPAPGARPSNYPVLYALGHPLVGNPGSRARARRVVGARAVAAAARRQGALERHLVRRRVPQCHRLRFRSAAHAGESQSRGHAAASSSRASLGIGEQWLLDASVTNAKSRIASTGGELRNRPEWRGGRRRALGADRGAASFRRPPPTWARRWIPRSPPATCGCDAYTRVDVSAAWQLSPRFETYLADRQSHRRAVRGVRGLRGARHRCRAPACASVSESRSPALIAHLPMNDCRLVAATRQSQLPSDSNGQFAQPGMRTPRRIACFRTVARHARRTRLVRSGRCRASQLGDRCRRRRGRATALRAHRRRAIRRLARVSSAYRHRGSFRRRRVVAENRRGIDRLQHLASDRRTAQMASDAIRRDAWTSRERKGRT